MKTDISSFNRPSCVSVTALAALCFLTLFLCQTKFTITKEMSREMYPPTLKTKDCWFLYSIGNPDRFKCVVRAFVIISSPILSLVSTALLIFGEKESNPYFFMPWLFLTLKGLVMVQGENILGILNDISTRSNFAFGFRVEDLKWILFYLTLFSVDVLEVFSFLEILDLFIAIWKSRPEAYFNAAQIEAFKKEIIDLMDNLSKYSFGSLSKFSMESLTDSETGDVDEARPIENLNISKSNIESREKDIELIKSKETNEIQSSFLEDQKKEGVPDMCNEGFKVSPNDMNIKNTKAFGDTLLKSLPKTFDNSLLNKTVLPPDLLCLL